MSKRPIRYDFLNILGNPFTLFLVAVSCGAFAMTLPIVLIKLHNRTIIQQYLNLACWFICLRLAASPVTEVYLIRMPDLELYNAFSIFTFSSLFTE